MINYLYRLLSLTITLLFCTGAMAQGGFRTVYEIFGTSFSTIENVLVFNDSTLLLAGERLDQQFSINAFALGADLEGNILWGKNYSTGNNSQINSFGSAFVEGYIAPDGNAVMGLDLQSAQGIAKIAPDGSLLWYRALPVTMVLRGWLTPEPDGSGSLIGVGSFASAPGIDVGYIANFDTDGQLTGAPGILESSLSTFRFYRAITDQTGNRYIIGYLTQSTSTSVIIKLPPGSNVPEWVRRYDASPTFAVSYGAIVLDNGNIIWGGSDGLDRAFLWQMAPDGSTVWRYAYSSPVTALNIRSIAKLDDGIAAVLGNSIVAKFSFEGDLLWAYDIEESGKETELRNVARSPDGGLLFVGAERTLNPERVRPLLIKTNAGGEIEGCCLNPVNILRNELLLPRSDLSSTQPNIPLGAVALNGQATDIGNVALKDRCPVEPFVFPLDSALCSPSCIDIPTPAVPDGATGAWSLPGGVREIASPDPDFSRLCFDSIGTFEVAYEVSSNACNIASYRRTITVKEPGEGDLELMLSDSVICPAECITIELSSTDPDVVITDLQTPGANVLPGNPNNYCYDSIATYSITALYEKDGCAFTTADEIRVQDIADDIPNVFTPNNDGINDSFKPIIDCPEGDYRLSIYNRWGEKVFETLDFQDGWDGTVNGSPAPSDVYIWVLDALTDPVLRKGDVTLLR